MEQKTKLFRITTVPISLKVLLRHQLRFMSQYFNVVGVSSGGKLLEEVKEQEGVKTISLEMTRAITPAKDVKAIWKLYRLLKKERPGIVHTHTPKAGLIGMVASKMAGVPIRLHTVAGLPLMETTGLKRKVLVNVERIIYHLATRIYPNSQNLAEFILVNKFCQTGKVKVLGNGSSNGIDMEYFKSSEEIKAKAIIIANEYGIKDDDFVYVFIGRLVKDKGIEELVKAFENLAIKFNQIKLLLVGPFESELDPVSVITEKKIKQNKNIIYVGFQKDIRPYLQVSHALAFPSYREGFPNVPMQAGCFNLPSIVTDINGCNEIIKPSVNGIIIPVKNVKALENAMELLLTDKQFYTQLKNNARNLIEQRYDQKLLWTLILKEYQELLVQHEIIP